VITLTAATSAASVASSAQVMGAAVTNNLTGTLKFAGAATVSLAGTFNSGTGTIAVSGGGYTITATLSSGKVSGTYTGPNGTGSVAALPSGATTSTIQVFCGTYRGTDSFGGGTPRPKAGVFDLVRSGDTLTGATHETQGGGLDGTSIGQVSGTSVSLNFYDASGSLLGSAGGTISGAAASGTYASTDGLATGTWSASTASCSDQPTWIQLSPSGGPPDGLGAVAMDALNNRLIAFGGISASSANTNAVWVLTNADGQGGAPQWMNVVPNGAGGAPPARHGHSAVYDATTNRLLVFGGCTGGCLPVVSDVWVLSNANGLGGPASWTPLSPTGTPPVPRQGQAAVYDPSSNRLIVWGGQDGGGSPGATYPEVWVLTNANGSGGTSTWSQLSPTGGPPPGQYGATAVYDAANNRMTVFGGGAQGTGNRTNAVWVLTNANGLGGTPAWTNLVPEGAVGSPPARAGQIAGYDPVGDRMTIFGGCLASACQPTDVWVLSNANGFGGAATWALLATSGGPPTATATGALQAASLRLTTVGSPGDNGTTWVLTRATDVGSAGGATPPVASVTVTPATATIAPGGSVQLTATTKDAVGNVLTGRLVMWTSSNTAVATVNPTGLVTGVSAGGPVTITATSEGQSGTGAMTVSPLPGGPHFTAVWGSGGTDVFAVASEATIWHYDGTTWGMQAFAPTFLNGIWGSSAGDVFAVGGSGTILHYDGTRWTSQASGTVQHLEGVWGSGGTDVFAVGLGGTILHYNGTTWSAQASGTTQALYRMWGSGGADVFAVGFGGTILHYNGTSWSPQASGTTGFVTNVWGSQGSNVFAVGNSGMILHYDGTSWSAQVSGTTQILYGLWGSGGADIFAVGGSGTILHYDGTSWSAQASGTTQDLIGVWGSGGMDVFAVGAGGTILHYDGTAWSQQLPSATPGSPSTFTVVSAGGYHTCGVTASDAGYCWGDNGSGDLGSGTTPDSAIPVPVTAVGGHTFATASTGNHFTCALTTNGAAYCWGDNSSGQLGNGTTTNSTTPVAAAPGITFATISAGLSHTCGVTPRGTAYCWGLNDNGQLGNGTTTNSSAAVAVSGGITFATVSAGGRHTCGVDSSAKAFCWGFNGTGQLGDGSTANSSVPLAVSGVISFAAVSAGSSHTCGVDRGGTALCWGFNGNGELGDGSTSNRSTPVVVGGALLHFANVSAGGSASHTCGVDTSGNALCWGFNGQGQLGNGTTTNSATPVPVSGGITFARVSGGASHTCGVTGRGAAYCWGHNMAGELGNGTFVSSSTPVPVK